MSRLTHHPAQPLAVRSVAEGDWLAGIGAKICPTACSVHKCIITGENICGHPRKGGLQPKYRSRAMKRLALALAFALALSSASAQVPPTGTTAPGVQITASATGTTGAVTATLAAAAGKVTYLCSVQIGEAGTGTATATTSNITGGTLNYVVTAPGNFTVTYLPCIPANAPNVSIPVATAANASATAVAIALSGYQR